jgi:hypothetical protein
MDDITRPRFDPARLRPGDTLLYRPVAFSWRHPLGWLFGRLIALKTWHNISHVEVFVGSTGGVAEARSVASRDGQGVEAYPVRLTDLAYVLRPQPVAEESFDLAAGLRWFGTVRGQHYDWLGLTRFVRTSITPSRTRMFCSAFWLRFYRACGFNPFHARIDADAIAPGEILDSPKLEVVWDDGQDRRDRSLLLARMPGVTSSTGVAIAALSLALAAPAAAQDAIDLRQAVIHNSPADVADWPATTPITRLEMGSPSGLSFTFAAQQTWPNYTPPGWTGPLQYTVWACVKPEAWHCAGFIQMWNGRPSTGAPILSDFQKNWAYDAARWGSMASYAPHPGDVMAFFVTAGNARGETGVTSVRERSNVVLVALPADDIGVFSFSATPPTPPPPPIVTPPPAPPITPPVVDNTAVLAAIADLKATMQTEHAEQTNMLKRVGRFIADNWPAIAASLGAYLVGHQGAK